MYTYLLNEAGTMNINSQLIDLGFDEIKPNLFIKEIKEDIKLYVDYRNKDRNIYAYNFNKVINHKVFKEYEAIMKIEKHLREQSRGTLIGFVNT